MKKSFENALLAVVTGVVSLIINSISAVILTSAGTASISRPILLSNKHVVVVTINNESGEMLTGVQVQAPSSTRAAEIVTQPAVVVEELSSSGTSSTKLLRISQIQPHQVTRLFVPSETLADSSYVSIVNSGESGLRLVNESRLESIWWNSIKSGFFAAAVLMLMIFFICGWLDERIVKLKKNHEEFESRANTMRSSLEEKLRRLEGKTNKLDGLVIKQRLLLQARLNDYARELSFWRSAIAKMLAERGAGVSDANALFEFVTKELGTFGTKTKSDQSFELIKIASRWVADAEREYRTDTRRPGRSDES